MPIKVAFSNTTKKFEASFAESNNKFKVEPTMSIGGGTNDHTLLKNRDLPDQHPIEAIADLRPELDGKLEDSDLQALSNIEIENLLRGVKNGKILR